MHWIPMEEIRRLYDPGYHRHWFDRSTMRFFRSRLPQGGYMTTDERLVYFVSSEQFEGSNGDRAERRYSIRVLKVADHAIDTIGDFQAYASRSGADAAARRLAESASPALSV